MKKLPTIEEIAKRLWRADDPPAEAQWEPLESDWKRIYRRMAREVHKMMQELLKGAKR